jgi:hypothetical protein
MYNPRYRYGQLLVFVLICFSGYKRITATGISISTDFKVKILDKFDFLKNSPLDQIKTQKPAAVLS